MLRPGENDLLTWCEQNGERGQRLIDEWNEDKNFNEYGMPMVMQEFYCFSNKKVWWCCTECGHEWAIYIRNRTQQGADCPICANKKRAHSNETRTLRLGHSLHQWCMANGAWGNKLIQEWDYEANEKELGVTLDTVTYASKKKLYWICCMCKNKFKMSAISRTGQMSACKHCSNKGTSYPEQFVYYSLKQIFPETISRKKLFNNIEYDIYIPEMKTCIEYNGNYWHKDKVERDEMKKQICLSNGYGYIRIDDGGEFDKLTCGIDYIQVPRVHRGNRYHHLKEVVNYIKTIMKVDNVNIDFVLADNKAMEMFCEGKKTLEKEFPELLKEWADDRNADFYCKSSKEKIKWQCTKCGCSWRETISDRTRYLTSCKYCGYNIFDNKIHKQAIKRKRNIGTLRQFI